MGGGDDDTKVIQLPGHKVRCEMCSNYYEIYRRMPPMKDEKFYCNPCRHKALNDLPPIPTVSLDGLLNN